MFVKRLLAGIACVCLCADLAAGAPRSSRNKAADKPVEPERAAPRQPGGESVVVADITDLRGAGLPSRVDLYAAGQSGGPISVDVPNGEREFKVPSGEYEAWVYVYHDGVPFLVDVVAVTASKSETGFVAVNLVEGNSKDMPLWRFDQDFDLVLDRVELAMKTDPVNPVSIPGVTPLPIRNQVLSKEAGWLKGELHCSSKHGTGTESVGELIRRAEKAGLDFLAITDRNTMAACQDPEFKSNKLILIPAMEWGDEARGVGLVYAPSTFPIVPETFAHAQAICRLVQAQGGIFAVAHPFFPDAPWQWGLTNVNAVQVWCRDYSGVPPLPLSRLNEELQVRRQQKLIHPIAVAAATAELSANGQAGLYWDYEMMCGLHASAIGGSRSSSPSVPLGRPLTYVYVEEKSLAGVLDGLRQGRTFVTRDENGPKIAFHADIRGDGKYDIPVGGAVPLYVETQFEVAVEKAKGKKLQVLQNGRPILTKIIEGDTFAVRFKQKPEAYSIYRVRVVEPAPKGAFGHLTVLAQSSPIYAQEIFVGDPGKMWISLKKQELPAEVYNESPAPMFSTEGEIIPDKVF